MKDTILTQLVTPRRKLLRRTLTAIKTVLSLAAGLAVSLSTQAAAPSLVSVTPARGATDVPVNTSLVFVFDQVMDSTVQVIPSVPPFLIGNLVISGSGSLPAITVGGAWDLDEQTFTYQFSSPLPPATTITWTLNPAGSLFPFQNAEAEPLATTSGSFTTGSGGGGGCDSDGIPDNWGGYSLSKYCTYEQTSAGDPSPASQAPFVFGAFVNSPQSGPMATAGSVTLPNASSKTLEAAPVGGYLFYSEELATEAALDAAYPAGNYSFRFTQTGQPERVIPMTIPAQKPPVPKIANFAEAQSVNAAQDFTLRWEAFAGAGANDLISLSIVETASGFSFEAPDPCVPRELPVTASSIVIPANTLVSNKTYSATLTFSRMFYSSTNQVPSMAGFGGLTRSTQFTLKTTGSVVPAAPARFTGFRLLPNGNPEMDLTGTAGRAYTILRSGALNSSTWPSVGTVTMNASGVAVFEDSEPGKTFPLFYQALAE